MPARFYDGRQARPHEVSLQMRDGQMLIRSADGAVDLAWPLNSLRADAEPGAGRGGAVRLRFGMDPARLLVDDPVHLAALRLGVRRWPRPARGWRFALATGVGLVVAGVLLVHSGPDLLAPLVPPAWEAGLGQGAQAAMLGGKRCTGADGQRALDRLVARLAEAGEDRDGPVQASVMDDGMVNAFTLPGRRVVVMRGLIAEASDGDELAAVIAHELGHVVHRDPTKAMLRALGLNVVAVAMGWGGLDGGQIAGTLLVLSYGRTAEAAADDHALRSLRAAGLRADGLARFFTRIESGLALPAFLSDHPPTAERRERAKAGPEGASAFTAAEWTALQGMCAAK